MLLVVGPFIRYCNPLASSVHAIPGILSMYCQFLFCFILNDILFYYGHRALHSKLLYKAIHKQHHQYTGTRSFAAEYVFFLEIIYNFS